jgi:NAD(P)-dependent dehydrogenase (short-subunit alcohol dehydrogenase family)
MGSIFCGSHALRLMREQGAGVVLNVTSSAQCGDAAEAVYAAAKGGVTSLTYSWAMAMRPFGVRVNAVAPTASTRMLEVTRQHWAPTVTWPPEQMTPLFIFLLSDRSQHITGQVIRLYDRRLSVMTHPSLAHPVVEQDRPWTVEDLADVFATDLAGTVHQELGLPRSVPTVGRAAAS